MRCIMLMFDSLNRHMLPPYNPETWVHAPNFKRLADRSITFDKSYVCSMPCMPARRDFHTGRPNFLHTNWGQLEAYDDSVPAMLSEAGIYTHLCTDHYHYFEDGGATYHGRYDSYEFYRGQEGDPFVGQVADPDIPDNINGKGRRSDWVNRQHIQTDDQYPQTRTFDAGVKFIDRNAAEQNWFIQIECFDPHEPFTTSPEWKAKYPSPDDQSDLPLFDWPPYDKVTESPEQVDQARRNYAALMTKCDHSLGRVLDAMDRHDMWQDTMLIVWTDHGYLLGEHNCWAKNWMPLYEQVSHTPFFIHDPRNADTDGQRRDALVQPSIDLGPTLLDFFGQQPTDRMTGKSLTPVIENDAAVRNAAVFGYFGNRINYTDGRYVYLPVDRNSETQLFRYSLDTHNMRGFDRHIEQAELVEPLPFTKDTPVMKVPTGRRIKPDASDESADLLFDLEQDPEQQQPLDLTDELRDRIDSEMAELMAQCHAPAEQFERMGLSVPV
jgi:arylsulfatase A-like enzyme